MLLFTQSQNLTRLHFQLVTRELADFSVTEIVISKQEIAQLQV